MFLRYLKHVRKDNDMKQNDDDEEETNNSHNELYEEELDDEEEEVCRLRCNEEKVKDKSSKTEESTEEEREKEHFNMLIDECVCNDFCNVCLHNLTHEEDKILQEEVK